MLDIYQFRMYLKDKRLSITVCGESVDVEIVVALGVWRVVFGS